MAIKTEREWVEAARDKFRRAEALIASGIKDVGNVVAINQAGGNAVLMNAASKAEAKMIVAFGGLKLAPY